MKIIKNPWKNIFLNLVSSSKDSIKILVPFVKENIVADIFSTKKKSSKFSLITSFKLMNFYSGVSDLSALKFILNQKGIVCNYQKLHSKVYIFDEDKAIVSSGNLTTNGMIRNYEYGILLEEKTIIQSIIADFQTLIENDNTGSIGVNEINKAQEILSKIPKSQPIKLPEFKIQKQFEDIEIYTGGVESILSSLSGWKLEVFKCLLKIPTQSFSLNDINAFVKRLSILYPNNKYIEPKIRQQLQMLRDIGLVEFLGNGKYKKLWA